MAKKVEFNRPTYIYTLSHPISKEVRYVGKTVKNLEGRLVGHIYSAIKLNRTHTHKWILNLLKNNLKPEIELLDSTVWGESQNLEKYWIAQLKAWEISLTNHTEGGEGNLGRIVSEETKKKQSKAIRLSVGKDVFQYDLDGNFLQEFSSIAEAVENVPNSKASHVIRVCKGTRRKHNQFRWDYIKYDKLPPMRDSRRKGVILSREHRNKAIKNLRNFKKSWLK